MKMNLSTSGLSLTADAAIDLQLHTIHSDGAWTPEALLNFLAREQFGLAAITDHDRPDTAVAIQQLAQARRLPVLVAVEMTAAWRGEMTDLLCFGFNPAPGPLHELAQGVWRRQQENTREVYENLQRQGYALPQAPDALSGILAKPSARQPHELVALLKQHGCGSAAGKIASAAGCTFATNDLAEVVAAAHQSGAVCLIAHPGRTDGFVTYDAQLLDEVRQEALIDGIEVYYPKHTPDQTALYEGYARRQGLLISAGSDSHSPDQPPIKYRAELCRALLERAGIRVA
jgi:3',5'-nucleoside bisphosphate phosphatase